LEHLLSIDLEKCTGCRNCELACSIAHTRTFNPARARIQVLKDEQRNTVMPMVCLQCKEPLCEEACPSQAIVRSEQGILYVEAERCIGCMNCVTACVYGGITLDPVSRKAIKCDLCGGEPACVAACEYKAISYLPRTAEGVNTRLVQSRNLPRVLGLVQEDM
jgi:carbon-monoxide dehydrogenase iron sulfur subunit